jgi:hypothetical protein
LGRLWNLAEQSCFAGLGFDGAVIVDTFMPSMTMNLKEQDWPVTEQDRQKLPGTAQ